MKTHRVFGLGVAALCVASAGCERQVSFSNDVRPILASSCVECHGSEAGEGEAVSGLSLVSYDDLMQGTRFGQVVVPGSAMSSALYLTVAQKTAPEIHMPPHHEDKLAEGKGVPLDEDEVETIRLWIEQGAPDN